MRVGFGEVRGSTTRSDSLGPMVTGGGLRVTAFRVSCERRIGGLRCGGASVALVLIDTTSGSSGMAMCVLFVMLCAR